MPEIIGVRITFTLCGLIGRETYFLSYPATDPIEIKYAHAAVALGEQLLLETMFAWDADGAEVGKSFRILRLEGLVLASEASR